MKSKKKVMIILTIIVSVLVAGCSNQDDKVFEVPFDGTMEHVHGLGYAGNDEGLYFASHTGLKIFRNGKWFETSKNFNDYMGFAAVDKGFYSSGHPGTDSNLPNPIGLQRSFDGGKTLEKIYFEGESDFHVMAVGYKSHDVIVLNEQKNSKLEAGIYLSEDRGESWTEVTASGLEGDILAFSIHPSNSDYIAAATSYGVYLSSDKGEKFNLITEEAIGTAVYLNDDFLYFASYDSEPKLSKYNIDREVPELMNLPKLREDGPVFVTQNPKSTEQLAIYTMKGQAYISNDDSETWEQILVDNEVQ